MHDGHVLVDHDACMAGQMRSAWKAAIQMCTSQRACLIRSSCKLNRRSVHRRCICLLRLSDNGQSLEPSVDPPSQAVVTMQQCNAATNNVARLHAQPCNNATVPAQHSPAQPSTGIVCSDTRERVAPSRRRLRPSVWRAAAPELCERSQSRGGITRAYTFADAHMLARRRG